MHATDHGSPPLGTSAVSTSAKSNDRRHGPVGQATNTAVSKEHLCARVRRLAAEAPLDDETASGSAVRPPGDGVEIGRRRVEEARARAAAAGGKLPAASKRRRNRAARDTRRRDQTYAPVLLVKKPRPLRAYLLLFYEFGGSRPWTGPMSTIAAALNCSTRQAQERIAALEATGLLAVERRPGQESIYRLLREPHYIEMPLELALRGDHAVCAVWGALRMSLSPGCSALRCATAVTQVAWETIQRITGLCRTVVAQALRWLRKHGWLSRRVVWASLRPIRRAVCRWRLRLRTPAETRTPPRQRPGQSPSGGSRNRKEPPAAPVTNPRIGDQADTNGVSILTDWLQKVRRRTS